MDAVANQTSQISTSSTVDRPLRILGISPEGVKNVTATTGYGSIVSYFFGGLGHHHNITLRDAEMSRVMQYASMLRSFVLQRSGWRRHAVINPWTFKLRSRLSHQTIKQLQNEVDIVIQWMGINAPFVGDPLKPYAMYLDYTTQLYDAHNYSSYPTHFYRNAKEQQLFYQLEGRAYRNASRVFTYNELVRRSVIEHYGTDPQKVINVGVGVCFDPLDPTIKKQYNSRKIVFIGKDSAFIRKGVPNLLAGFMRVREIIPDAQLILIGLSDSLVPAHSGVVNMGFVRDRQKLRQILQEAALFAITPLVDPSPGVIREAMAMKLPVVASNVDGIPDMVIDGETGYLVPPQEPDKLAKAIIALLQDESKMQQMGEKGYARATQRFTWDNVLGKVEPHLYAMVDEAESALL